MGCKTRGNTGVLLDDLLIDIGCGTVKQLGRFNIETKNIKYILISHYHPDHFGDIGHFLITRYSRRELNNNIKIIGPIGLEERIKTFLKMTELRENLLDKVEIIELNENAELVLNEFKIKPVFLNHGGVTPTYGYIIEKENKKIGYTCDTTICDNFEEICKNVDYLIGDANQVDTTPMHMGLTDFTEYAKKYPDCNFFAIHRGDYEERNKYVNFPEDGDILNI